FDQEAMAAARLNHPNIVQAYDIGLHKRYHYIVMEYVEGRDLQDVVKDDGPLDYDLAANYIRQASEGLAYAHQSGLIHRDIKPANLLVDGRGVVKLLDLGLARFVDDKNPSLTIAHDENVLGTADYLPPEQAVDSHRVDSRSDIYSLGCTLYYLLTGHPPFPTGTLPQRIHAHQTKSPASIYVDRRDAPQALVDVCNRMMAKSPEARFQTAKEVADALAAWLANRSKGSAGGAGGGGRAEPAARPSAPPRRSGTAVAPPPRRDKPGKSNDTISDKESETFKGPPAGRPQPATSAQTRPAGSGSGSSGKLGKSGPLKPGDSGRAAGRSGSLPTARAIDAPEDPDDLTSVLFGTSAIGSNKTLPRSLVENRRPAKQSKSAKLPDWISKCIWIATPALLFIAVAVIVIGMIHKWW
ncbi:MAG TPA: serine/threonine-protein kinase, partial [Pirellulales bacterium]|nr:serine/threonine-protein kinase [Pirellulales bacterium]